jgi:hypothetical protein
MRKLKLITEGRANYLAMFRGVLSAPEITSEEKKWIEGRIDWANNVLKKSDRVVWYLRYIKAIVMDHTAVDDSTPGSDWVRTFDPDAVAFDKPLMWSLHTLTTKKFYDQIAHFMSLECPAIQNMVFGKEGIQDVMRALFDHERDWALQQKGKIYIDHPNNRDAEVLLDFKNGWQWINLHRASCSEEGKAMGHCGNLPRSHSGDTILTLRKLVTKAGKPAYEPHLTFTMDENWYLSERKGRGNSKPAQRYHEMIVALLLLNRGHQYYIEGIGDSHWEAEQDFVIDDLDPELRKKLLNRRPEFGNAYEYWQGTRLDHCNLNILQGKIAKMLLGKYNSSIRVKERIDDGQIVVSCTLSIPSSFCKALDGELMQDPFTIGSYMQSDRWKNRRARARELHQDELDLILNEVLTESLEDTRQRFLRMTNELTPFFAIENRPSGTILSASRRVEATAPVDWFLRTLAHDPDSSQMAALLQLMDSSSEMVKELSHFGDNEIARARVRIKAQIDKWVAEDIAKYGDVEGAKLPGDDLPKEDWEDYLEARYT